jgi:hypothetical protein
MNHQINCPLSPQHQGGWAATVPPTCTCGLMKNQEKGCCEKCDASFGGGSTMLPRIRMCSNLDCPCHTAEKLPHNKPQGIGARAPHDPEHQGAEKGIHVEPTLTPELRPTTDTAEKQHTTECFANCTRLRMCACPCHSSPTTDTSDSWRERFDEWGLDCT